VDDLSEWGIGLLIIDGGEPLCREDLLDILKYASSNSPDTGIYALEGTQKKDFNNGSLNTMTRSTYLSLDIDTENGIEYLYA